MSDRTTPAEGAPLTADDVRAILMKAGLNETSSGQALGGLMLEFIRRMEVAERDLGRAARAFIALRKRVDGLEPTAPPTAEVATPAAAPNGTPVAQPAQDAPSSQPAPTDGIGLAGATANNPALAVALAAEESSS